jgi:hypothetical protein
VQQILQPYIDDYFDKEITHTRLAQVDGLRRAVGGDQSLISKVHIVHNPWPTLRAERLKGIHGMVCTVANRRYLESVFSLTTDSVVRMEGIGKGDKRLPVKIKELFDWHLGFLAESVLIPVAKTASTLLLKYAATSTQSTDLPPLEFVAVLESMYWAAGRLKTHFEEVFAAPMSEIPSLSAVCKDSRRAAMRILEALIREALQAFTLGISMHISKVLSMIQSKYDYAPQLDAVTMGITKIAYAAGVAGGDVGYEGSGMDPSGKVKGATQACCHACYAVVEVIKYVRSQQVSKCFLSYSLVSMIIFSFDYVLSHCTSYNL